jgi:SAM-dependent methyltransferase
VTNKILDHFEREASRYHENSEKGLWAWHRKRERKAVFDLLGPLDNHELMDLGCGAGHYVRYALDLKARHVVGVDLSPSMVAALPKKHVTGIVSQAETVTFSRQISRILSAGLLEFVSNPQALLKNALKLVEKENGILVLLVPTANLWGEIYRIFHHRNGFKIHLFSKDSIVALAEQSGWSYSDSRMVPPFSLVCKFKVKQ